MAEAVGVTCGIAAQLLLDGHEALSVPDVLAFYKKEICDPIREHLEREGIDMAEKLVQDSKLRSTTDTGLAYLSLVG